MAAGTPTTFWGVGGWGGQEWPQVQVQVQAGRGQDVGEVHS